jgi:hypothetical protein
MPKQNHTKYGTNKLGNLSCRRADIELNARKKLGQEYLNQQPVLTPYERGIVSCDERLADLDQSIADLKQRLDLMEMFGEKLGSVCSSLNGRLITEKPDGAKAKTLLQISYEETTRNMIRLEKTIYICKKNTNSQIGKGWSDKYEGLTMNAMEIIEKMVEAGLYSDSDYATYIGQANKQMEMMRFICVPN